MRWGIKHQEGAWITQNVRFSPRPELLQPCGDLWDEPLARGTNEGSG